MTLAGLNEKTHLIVILDLIELIFYIVPYWLPSGLSKEAPQIL